LGATPDGKLVSLQHDYVYNRSMLDDHHEDCGEATAFQYSVPNLRVTFGRARRNIGATGDLRGPGAVPGLYAAESAMNELGARAGSGRSAWPAWLPPSRRRSTTQPEFACENCP
jgi:xanthine dehydrogenase YagR molybdenum-binding subunit